MTCKEALNLMTTKGVEGMEEQELFDATYALNKHIEYMVEYRGALDELARCLDANRDIKAEITRRDDADD